jgi:hypothetical protein
MPETRYTRQEIVRLGKERYEREIRPLVEVQHRGKLLAIDILTGDYEVDSQAGPACRTCSSTPVI